MQSYIKDGDAIYRESFSIIRAEADLSGFSATLSRVVMRMIHACGMVDLPQYISASEGAAEIGRSALLAGAPILCDTAMVAAGITRTRLPRNNEVVCTLRESRVPELAKQLDTTRTAAALELWRERIAGSVVVIGNAPTALFRLMEMCQDGTPHPALVLGLPVGFVGAAESKALLASNKLGLAYLVVQGRRGGSAVAAAAINALASDTD